MLNSPTHPCAVCPKPIGHPYLMCVAHWRLVPHEQQQAVYRTLSLAKRTKGGSGYAASVHCEYFIARDCAIQSAREAMAAPAGLPVLAEQPRPPVTPAIYREDHAT